MMKTRVFGIIILLLMVYCVSTVSAVTCAFINITTGPMGPANMTINMTPNMTANMTPGTTNYLLLDNLPDLSQYPFLNGTRSVSGVWNFGGFNISNLLNPVAVKDAATKDYVDIAIAGVGSPDMSWNTSYSTINNMSSNNATLYSILTSNLSSTNNTMKAYVDNAVAGMSSGGNTSQFLFLNGTRVMTGSLNVDGFGVNNLQTITDDSSAVNKSFVEHSPTITNLSAIYPIGTVYITTTGTNPADLFGGFGTWNDLGTGYVLVGV